MAPFSRQSAARITKGRHQRMSEEARRAVDGTHAKLSWATNTKANCTMLSSAVFGWRYIPALRDGEQMQRHTEK